MEALIVLALTFGLLWVLFILPQQRRVRAHQRLVLSLEEGDEVVLTAGIFGRITRLGPEELDLEVAPGVVLRVARQAVLRRVEHAIDGGWADADGPAELDDDHRDHDPVDDAEAAEAAGESVSDAAEPAPARIDSDAVGDNNADRPDGDRTAS